MQYRTMGRTGVQVSTLVLGAMNFGSLGRTTQDEVTAMVNAALEGGINLIDTADMYSQGESEEMIGKAIAGRRDDIVLATKASMPMGDERNHQGSSRRWLVTELDSSLRRLGVNHVDLYQIHRWDPRTSDEETLSALTDLQRAGKIRYFGSSTFPAYRIVQAEWAAPGEPPEPLRHRAAQLLNSAARDRDPRPARDRAVRTRRAGVEPVGLGLAVGRDPRGPGNQHQPLGTDAATLRHCHPRQPGQARCRRAAGQSRRRGRPDHDPARARIRHRTPRRDQRHHRAAHVGHLHSQLAAADTVLSGDVLDAIDAIVAPGVNLAAHEKHDTPPALLAAAQRRR